MASPFSDTESIASIESTSSGWSTASSTSSRTSIDSSDSAFLDADVDTASHLIAGISSTIDSINESLSALLVRMESLAETLDANAAAMQQILEANTVILQRCSEGSEETIGLVRETLEITRSIWEDMPGCRERRRAEAGRNARRGLFGRFLWEGYGRGEGDGWAVVGIGGDDRWSPYLVS